MPTWMWVSLGIVVVLTICFYVVATKEIKRVRAEQAKRQSQQ